MLRLRALVLPVIALALIAGCGGGIKEKDMDEAQARIDQLKAKGVPDDKVSTPRVHLYSAREHFGKNNKALAKKEMESMEAGLLEAEKFYSEQVATLGPKIEAAKSKAQTEKSSLSGHQVKKIDSLVRIVDSFKTMDWLLQANSKADELVALLPYLKEDEAKSTRIRRQIPGEWVFEDRAKSVEHKDVNALTRKVFRFQPGNKVHLTESKKGQSGPYLREDWEFNSWGTYDFRGDTIMLQISRFQALRQMFTRIHMVDGKPVWKDEPGPTYDSAITDGSQDRHVTFEDLKADFKKVR
ncbi:MAG: hypothetical protein FWC23_01500 [Chitinispirillia bacterium]|nr:hypothetical protein [Chitinispirillia bacterium]MCL2267851.1 hypothetical protein [Chitinispirillia bacterium]